MTPVFHLEDNLKWIKEQPAMEQPDKDRYIHESISVPDYQHLNLSGYNDDRTKYENHIASLRRYPAIGFDGKYLGRNLVENMGFKLVQLCHDDSTPPFSNFCSYCNRSRGCSSEDKIAVPMNYELDYIHVNQPAIHPPVKEQSGKEAIEFADWIREQDYFKGRFGTWSLDPTTTEAEFFTTAQLYNHWIQLKKSKP